ncbi:MAG: ferric reductase-like transmembrane domain-containing protein [Burkholderiales bacterium]|nr:ferric reductase-like transmembrane domain-containing protein [Burkholderiales bacterium]
MALAGLPALLQMPAVPLTLSGMGVLTGWLGCGALAASLMLMVREPAIASCFGGLDRMYRWHHLFGVAGYVLLLSHPLFLAGQALPAHPQSAWQIISPGSPTWSGMLGWGALLGLMLGLGATFATRLRYSVWRPLHALLSVGVLLGIAHVLLLGGLTAAAWVVMLPIVLALTWRMLRVDRGQGARPYEVSSASCLSDEIVEVSLRPLAQPLAAVPGQFVMAAFFEGPHYRGCGEYHPYTISGAIPDGGLRLNIKALGDCTRTMQSLEAGVAARIQGPFGEFFASRNASPEVWIAGGIGVTPFLAQLRLGEVTRPTEFIYVYRTAQDACYLDEMERYAATHPLLHFQPLVSQNDLVPLYAMLAKVTDLPARQAYLCGPRLFVAAVSAWLKQHGMREQSIHFENFEFRS